jgi:hypothetical protein
LENNIESLTEWSERSQNRKSNVYSSSSSSIK